MKTHPWEGMSKMEAADDMYFRFKKLLELCDSSEALAKGEDGEQLKAMVFTKHIRRILEECS